MHAWLFQDTRQKQKLGDKAPWSVGYYDPDGRKKSKRVGSKSNAEKFARKIEGQLAAGTYENKSRKLWSDFMVEYESKVLASMTPRSRETTQGALNHFVRIINPVKVQAITSRTFSDYVAVRRQEPSIRRPAKPKTSPQAKADATKPDLKPQAKPKVVSPATVNCELRSLRAVIRKAVRWGYLVKPPEIEFLKEPGKLPTYVTPEHFAKIYTGCESARWPEEQPFSAAEWWQALLVTAYMTGWRIGSLLSLKWSDVDLEAATALSRAADNKGKRDQLIPLHPLVVQHLRKLKSFSPVVFPWNHDRRSLFIEFDELQRSAGVRLTGNRDHYGFHDLRRAFATMNADKLTADALQALMQHKDYQTTQRYISMARQLNPAVANLYVPTLAVAVGG